MKSILPLNLKQKMKIAITKIAKAATLFSIVLLTVIGCEKPKNKIIPTEKAQQLKSLAAEGSITGLQLAYFDAEYDYQFQTGFRSNIDSTLVDENTVFEAASLSKQVTAALVHRLADENILDLDEKISQIWQAPRLAHDSNYTKINFRHLLSHTTGLPNWSGELLETSFEPGSDWQYSGEGYVLIAKTLEQKLGESFEELCKKWVFEPLSMTNSSFTWKEGFVNNVTEGHTSAEVPQGTKKRTEANAAASLYTTAADYQQLIRGIFVEDFLSSSSNEAFINEIADIKAWDGAPTGLGWAQGIGTNQREGKTYVWQWGDNYLHRGFVMIEPEEPKALVYLTNTQNGLSILQPMLGLFFDETFEDMISWLDYQKHDDPELTTAIALEKAFYWMPEEEASRVLEELIKEEAPLDDNMFNNTVWALFQKKELQKSTSLINAYIEAFPNSAEAYARKGEALGFAHDYQQSWLAYQQAMDLNPDLSPTLLPRFPWYQEATAATQQKSSPLSTENYIGDFGEITISSNGNNLSYSDTSQSETPLFRLSNEVFDLDNLETFRLIFEFKNGEVIAVTKSHLSGEKERFIKDNT